MTLKYIRQVIRVFMYSYQVANLVKHFQIKSKNYYVSFNVFSCKKYNYNRVRFLNNHNRNGPTFSRRVCCSFISLLHSKVWQKYTSMSRPFQRDRGSVYITNHSFYLRKQYFRREMSNSHLSTNLKTSTRVGLMKLRIFLW